MFRRGLKVNEDKSKVIVLGGEEGSEDGEWVESGVSNTVPD